ncbi:MAG TPA: MraY family glycosyltransferase [Bacteriovoracaceae bacterium]|nr:MraY family glycosyltransferase [Bacteriovoracaceae bacterium]
MRRWLLVNADKSDSNALQVGGIPFSLISMVAISSIFLFFRYLFQGNQAEILHYALYSWIGILVYGYLDDKYEIRPVVKLASQMFLISIFCLKASQLIYPQNSAIAFLWMLFFSTAVVNGSNLIDGLDTISFKVSSVIYLAFLVLAAPVQNLPALFISCACFFHMCGFYFFNREPAKIHLGEVGVSCLGFSYIVLGVLTYERYAHFNPSLSALSKALFPCVLPLVELTSSFLRRLLTGKAAFKGDRLHIHHILHDVKELSASTASSLIGGFYFVYVIICLMLMEYYSSEISFMVLVFLTSVTYLLVGWKTWFVGKLHINIFQLLLVKKEVRIISSDTLSDFSISINKPDAPDKRLFKTSDDT